MDKSMMERKRLMATMYLKNGEAITSKTDDTILGEATELARIYNDSGIDKILLWDISETEDEHKNTMKVIREINRVLEISSYALGWTNSVRDIKEYLYSGCRRVILCSSNPQMPFILEDCQKRFRKDRLSLAIDDVDLIFKKRKELEEDFHDVYVFQRDIFDSVVNMTDLPFYAVVEEDVELDVYKAILKTPTCMGVAGPILNQKDTDINLLKHEFFEEGILVLLNDSQMDWSEFKLDDNGLIAVVSQDYSTKKVLNYGYMNEEAFKETIASGKMHYYDKATGEVRKHGVGNGGQYQYVKSLSVDCHRQAILAKVSQIGVACHTGNYSCFYTEILKKDYTEKNTVKLLENIYNIICNRKKHPREGSFTNFLLDKGINEISRKLQSESTEIIISAKDEDVESMRTQMSDLLYFMMVLMSEYDITWDDITNELAQRK
ncbi:MAG: phosphoribosyl-ATP diphosphatase [Lachnospiraceae bacterium]|nr:phosphoribosyl-ATP diphosphatase [Lachnospiraceae bacterium]